METSSLKLGSLYASYFKTGFFLLLQEHSANLTVTLTQTYAVGHRSNLMMILIGRDKRAARPLMVLGLLAIIRQDVSMNGAVGS
jgi:hypothetical protein